MGSPPPVDAPSPEVQDATAAAASLPAAPTGIAICGFAIPGLPPFPSFALPAFPPDFGFPPAFALPIPMLCDLANALADEFGPGGGRVGIEDLEKDPED